MNCSTFARDVLTLAFPRSTGFLVTLGVYMDRSGPNADIPAVTVAGVISTVEGWDAFNEEWFAALQDFENLPHFHMTDFESGTGFYENWQARGVRKERLRRLLAIIERHVLAVVGATVSIADCKSYFQDPPLQTALGITATHCFMLLPQFRYVAERPTERIVYTFEAGDEGYGKLQAQYDDMYANDLRRAYNRLSGKLEVERKDFPPLQAADIFAFEGWKQWAREHGGDSRSTRYPFGRLSESIPSQWATLKPTHVGDILPSGPHSPPLEALLELTRGWVMPTTQLPPGMWD